MKQSIKRLWQFHRQLGHIQSPPQHPCHGCGEIALVKILAGENRTLKRKARALERENLALRAQLQRARSAAIVCLSCNTCQGKGGAP